MTRGNVDNTKVIYHGETESFAVFVDSMETYNDWKKDESTPLSQVISGPVYTIHKGGAQGMMDLPSRNSLQNEFGTSDEDEVIKKILKTGSPQIRKNQERNGDTNEANGQWSNHS